MELAPEAPKLVRRVCNKAISRTTSTGTSSTIAPSAAEYCSDQDWGMQSSSDLSSVDGASNDDLLLRRRHKNTADASQPLISSWVPKEYKALSSKQLPRSDKLRKGAPAFEPPVAISAASVAPPVTQPIVPIAEPMAQVQHNWYEPQALQQRAHLFPYSNSEAQQAARLSRRAGGMPVKVALSSTISSKQLDPQIPAKKKPPYPELVEPKSLDPSQPVKKHVNETWLSTSSFLTCFLQDLQNTCRCY